MVKFASAMANLFPPATPEAREFGPISDFLPKTFEFQLGISRE
jgi:hypothetical protein